MNKPKCLSDMKHFLAVESLINERFNNKNSEPDLLNWGVNLGMGEALRLITNALMKDFSGQEVESQTQ